MRKPRNNIFNSLVAKKRCTAYRKRILEVSRGVTALHIAPAFSCLEMTDIIYHELMRRDGSGKFLDTFIMSKGHGCMSQYVILEELKILTRKDLKLYCKPKGKLGAHPDFGIPGISASTGSLGHGMGIATGMAYAHKLLKRNKNIYTLLSDGEFQEGSTWEAMMVAANLNVNNLIAFLDLNDFQSLSRTSVSHKAFYPIIDKVLSFGWEATEVNGHDSESILHAVSNRQGKKPFLLIGHTIKGKGISYMENEPIWHYRSPNNKEYKQAMKELRTKKS
ncbi:MAG: transketolase [Rickettsiales bacterium]|nr:transketolase [Rickettsiales bacterium]|tara:strand:- start:7989 stop:8819 length:831 start_codon:yes stop_codon:yes gene_type:complete